MRHFSAFTPDHPAPQPRRHCHLPRHEQDGPIVVVIGVWQQQPHYRPHGDGASPCPNPLQHWRICSRPGPSHPCTNRPGYKPTQINTQPAWCAVRCCPILIDLQCGVDRQFPAHPRRQQGNQSSNRTTPTPHPNTETDDKPEPHPGQHEIDPQSRRCPKPWSFGQSSQHPRRHSQRRKHEDGMAVVPCHKNLQALSASLAAQESG